MVGRRALEPVRKAFSEEVHRQLKSLKDELSTEIEKARISLSSDIESELNKNIKSFVIGALRIEYDDPLQESLTFNEQIKSSLSLAANSVGDNIVVGRRVLLCGGRTDSAVGLRLGDGVRLYEDCRLTIDHVDNKSGIVLGRDVSIGYGTFLDGSGYIEVGDRTIIGQNVVILSSNHRRGGPDIQSSGKTHEPVKIGRSVWIGANVTILAGVVIGDRATIGAGAVVTHDVPCDSLAVGVPARVRD